MNVRFIGIAFVVLGVLTGCRPSDPAATTSEPSSTAKATAEPEPEVAATAKTEPEVMNPEAAASAIRLVTLDELESLGVKVGKNDDGSVKSIDFTARTDKGDSLALSAENLDSFKSIRVVRGDSVLSGEMAAALARMPRLTELLWTNSTTDSDTLRALAGLPELKKLRLSGVVFQKGISEALATFPALTDLDISGSTVADDDLTALAGAPKLAKINLYQTKIGDGGVKNLLPLADRLTSLNLDATLITDESAKTLEAFGKLTFLHLGRSAITDAATESLAKLKTLEKLHVSRTKMTDAGFKTLKEKLPRTEVVTKAAE